MGGDDKELVLATLRAVMRDGDAPAAARAAAARTLAEIVGVLGRHQASPGDKKSVSAMSRAELESMLAEDSSNNN